MRPARLVAATAALLTVSACSSVTDGSGRGGPSGTSTGPSTATSSGTPSSPGSTSASPSSSPTPTPTPTTSTVPPPTTPLRTVTVKNTISGATYVIKVWADRKDPTCTDHAYGTPVINYLKAHPCGGLQRLLATTTVKGRAVGFAEARLGFVGSGDAVYTVAGDFSKLVTEEGTGNINDLLREGYRLPSGPTSVPSPSAFSALGQDAGVIIDELWYLTGTTPDNDPALITLARDIFLQFG